MTHLPPSTAIIGIQQRSDMAQAYRGLAASRISADRADYYLARARHLEELAGRALRIAQREDQAG